jgi:hypothetical protein
VIKKSKNNFIRGVGLEWILNHDKKWTKQDIRNAMKEIMNDPGYVSCSIRQDKFCMKFKSGSSNAVKALLTVLHDGLNIEYDADSYSIEGIDDTWPWRVVLDNEAFVAIIEILCYVQRAE